ncbi:MAG: hypothetical protein NTW05_06510 [Pseudonocardiales bacterium]|nr:hypothetical protein [Pseudonocardiales bacterium]
MARPEHPALVLGGGTGFLLAGLVLFLQEAGLLVPYWSLALPLILVLVGVVTVVSGATGAHRSRAAGR